MIAMVLIIREELLAGQRIGVRPDVQRARIGQIIQYRHSAKVECIRHDDESVDDRRK